MKCKLMVLILITTFVTSLISFSSYANESSTSLSYITDTTSFSQEQYLNLVEQFSTNTIEASSTDNKIIQLTCEAFLAMAKASVRKPDEYDPSIKILPSCLEKGTIQYRLSDYEYQSELNNALDHFILSDELAFTDFEVTYSEDEAIASIVESYTYYINDGFDNESFRRKKYTFKLHKSDSQWYVTDVITDDPWEQEKSFVYKKMDVQASISNLFEENVRIKANPIVLNVTKTDEISSNAISDALYSWTYNKDLAVAYAEAHYDDTENSVFGYNSSNNCQNFSSQCVWAGLGGSGTDKYALPSVPTSRVGTDVFNVWCAGQDTTYYNEYYFNWPWNNVCSFMKLMKSSITSAEGPYGNAFYSYGVELASVGDVLAVNWDGIPDEASMDHAMFVTQVSGNYGSRTKSDVKIAAHTSRTNSAYESLSSYTTAPIGNFGKSEIWRGNYSIQQP